MPNTNHDMTLNKQQKKERGKERKKECKKEGKHFIEIDLKVNCTHIQYTCTLGDIKIYFAPQDNCSWVQICYSEYKMDIKATLVSYIKLGMTNAAIFRHHQLTIYLLSKCCKHIIFI